MSASLPSLAESTALECWQEGAVFHLRFNRPQVLNAINVQMAREFSDACERIVNANGIRAVWIRGAGRAFMAGGDLVALEVDPQGIAAEIIEHMHKGLLMLSRLPVPVVASVQGAVSGGGLGVMLGCDLVVAADDARFSMAYPLIGASGDCSTTWGLTHLLGTRKALELALLAEPIDAREALRLTLVNRVVAPEMLEETAAAMVDRLAAGPTVALGRLKQLVRMASQNDLATQLECEASGFVETAGTADFREGVAAFLGKRPANFRGN